LSQDLLPNQLSFNPETDVNLETGYKADLLDHRLKVNADVFYLHRNHAQIKTSFQSYPTDPTLSPTTPVTPRAGATMALRPTSNGV
jgi:outer membrane receptor for ferric coprogen and ferric-rhodotorulic acid